MLDPRVGEQYEAGLKGRFLRDAVNVSAAVFRSKDENPALADTGNPGFFVQADVAQIEGFEFEVTGRPMAGLDLVASYRLWIGRTGRGMLHVLSFPGRNLHFR